MKKIITVCLYPENIVLSVFATYNYMSTGLYNATKTLAFASYFCKMRIKILY